MVVNKPAGIGIGTDDSGDDTLLEFVRTWNSRRQETGKKGYCVPIHFLDRPVSGAVLFGLSSKGAARLNEQFRNRQVRKVYHAVVEGVPDQEEGTLNHFLRKDSKKNKTTITNANDSEGKESVLDYKVIERISGLSVIEVRPKTGRSHQIRVQLSSLGTPIVGDLKYGASAGWDGRIGLHAVKIGIKHPTDKTDLEVIAPFPKEWQQRFK